MCYDSNGAGWSSFMPHVKGSAYIAYPSGVKPAPTPDGLAVGHVDGSANWVKWSKLNFVTAADKFYYEVR
jgi:hypothetical protein